MEAAKYPIGKVIAGAYSVHFQGVLQKESIAYTDITDVTVSRFFKRISVESSRGRTSATLWSMADAIQLAKVIRQNAGLAPVGGPPEEEEVASPEQAPGG